MNEKLLDLFFSFTNKISENFFTFHKRPKFFRSYLKESALTVPGTLSIIIQGGIGNGKFVEETVKLYKYKLFKGANIIVSTWSDEEKSAINRIKKLNIDLVISDKPQYPGISNINLQITSTFNGLEKAIKNGAMFLMKTRTDQRIYAPNVFNYLVSILDHFPSNHTSSGKRLVGVSLNTFINRLYGLSDMFMFGLMDDMVGYWSAPLDMRSRKEILFKPNMSMIEYSKFNICEVYLMTNYLKNIGYEINWSLEDSFEVYSKYFAVVDAHSIDLFWNKYTFKEFRWMNYFTPDENFSEMTFLYWLALKDLSTANKNKISG